MNEKWDIAVIGAGAAGLAAAISAARAGARTLLMDARPGAGGTGGFSGLTTLCGLYDDAGEFLNYGFAREFAEAVAEGPPERAGRVWILAYRPEKFRAVAEQLISSEKNLETAWNRPVTSVETEQEMVARVNGKEVGCVIDCTGQAEIAQATDAPWLATDETTQASAIIFPLRGVRRSFATPTEAAQVLLPVARAGFAPVNFREGLAPGTLTVKFAGRAEDIMGLVEFLRAQIAGFENCHTAPSEFTLARRAGRMTVGEYVLTGADVLAGRKFDDAAARGAWPIEQWDAAGRVRYRYLEPGTHYEIPRRSLRSARWKNVFMAGKTISADVDAMGSARVMGICLATGAAAARLAAEMANARLAA